MQSGSSTGFGNTGSSGDLIVQTADAGTRGASSMVVLSSGVSIRVNEHTQLCVFRRRTRVRQERRVC